MSLHKHRAPLYTLLAVLLACSSFGLHGRVARAQTTPQASSTSVPADAPTSTQAQPIPNISVPPASGATPATTTPTRGVPIKPKPILPKGVPHATTTRATTTPVTAAPAVATATHSELGVANNTPGGTANPFGGSMFAVAFIFFIGAGGFITYGARMQRKKKKKSSEKKRVFEGPCDGAKLALEQKTSEAAAVESHISIQEKLLEALKRKLQESVDAKVESTKSEVKTKIVEGVKRKVYEADESGVIEMSVSKLENTKALYDETKAKIEQAEKLLESLKTTYQTLLSERGVLEKAYQTCLLSVEGAGAAKSVGGTVLPILDLATKNLFIEKTMHVDGPASSVWRVFADKSVSRKMGGEYVTDWKVGSPFGWKGARGEMYTKGNIINIKDGEHLEHTLLVDDDEKKIETLYSTISYTLTQKEHGTELYVRETFAHPVDDEEFGEVEKTWDQALVKVKEIAEGLTK